LNNFWEWLPQQPKKQIQKELVLEIEPPSYKAPSHIEKTDNNTIESNRGSVIVDFNIYGEENE